MICYYIYLTKEEDKPRSMRGIQNAELQNLETQIIIPKSSIKVPLNSFRFLTLDITSIYKNILFFGIKVFLSLP